MSLCLRTFVPGCLVLMIGCAHIPNQWVEDGPAAGADLQSPTAADVYARYESAEPRTRGWETRTVSSESGAVTHWPLYFEDPFEDKGHGRSDYRLGWEDYVGMMYGYSRYTLNWLTFPISAVVTPPCRLMESDGVLSKQALGYDHDASRAGRPPAVAPACEEPEPTDAPEAAETAQT